MGSGENLPIITNHHPNFTLKIVDNYFPSTPLPDAVEPLEPTFDFQEDIKDELTPQTSPQPQNKLPAKRPSKLSRISKKTLAWLQTQGNKLLNLLRHYASWVSFLQTLTSALLERIPALILRITDFISPVGRIINGLKLLHNTIYHRKGDWTRRFSLIASFGSIGLGIAAILLPPLGLIFATANIASNTFLSLWAVGVSIKNKLALRSIWKNYDLELLSTLPASGPLRTKFYLGLKNNILTYRVSHLAEEKHLTMSELTQHLGAKRAHDLHEALKKAELDGKLDELYPFQKEILKISAKKKHTSRENIRRQIEQDEKEFYSALSDPAKLKKYEQFKNKDPQVYQDETNFKLSELEGRILEKTNQERKLNAHLATQVYNAGIMLLALTGIIMSFFPPTIIAGASILIATSIHGILFGYDLSGKWPQRVQNFFFGPRSADSIDELKLKVAVHKEKQFSSTAATALALRGSSKSPEARQKPNPVEETSHATVSQTSVTEQQQPRANPSSFWKRLLNTNSEPSSTPPANTYLDVMPIH